MAVSSSTSELVRLDETLWEIPAEARPDMRVPARIFADRELLEAIVGDRSLEQLQNVATLPGIVEAALAMPDIHQGYGFPVGGVAAMELPDGVVSPGGVGYDINCGVRLLALPLSAAELGGAAGAARARDLARDPGGRRQARAAPAFADRSWTWCCARGPRALVDRGIGREDDLERTESQGCLPGADPAAVSARAHERGAGQLGTLGAGNHFIELQRVDHVFDPAAAAAFGLAEGRLTVLIHSGSRGLGHQVCTDYVRMMDAVRARYGIELPDRQLACAPASSPEGRAYLAAMAAAAELRLREPARDGPRRPRGDRPRARRARPPTRRARSTTSPTTWPRSSATAGARCSSTARARRARSRPDRPRSPPTTARSASPSSSPAAWARRASCSPASRARWSAPSARPATAPAARCPAPAPASRSAARELRRQLEAQGIVVRCPSNKGLGRRGAVRLQGRRAGRRGRRARRARAPGRATRPDRRRQGLAVSAEARALRP